MKHLRQIPGIARNLVSSLGEKSPKNLDGLNCAEDVIDRKYHEDVGGGVAELENGEHVVGDPLFFWPCCDSSKLI